MDSSIIGLWGRMGVFGNGIVAILLILSVIAGSVAVAKWWQLRRLGAATRAFSQGFARVIEDENLPAALALARESDSHVARVMREALRSALPLLQSGVPVERAADAAERAIEREQILLAAELKDGLGRLATVAATAPFLGLLGTVTGIMASFLALSRTGGGGVEVIAAGVGEALITTAVGLVVAIPSVWLYNYFNARLDMLFSELTYAGRELVDWMVDHPEAAASASMTSESLQTPAVSA